MTVPPAAVRRPSWFRDTLRPSATVERFEIGERSILFCERQQLLFELNDTAGLLWRAVAAGQSAEAAADMLLHQGVAPAEAVRFAGDAVESWLEQGLLVPQSLLGLDHAQARHRLNLVIGPFACRLDIHGDASDPIRPMIEPVFSQFSSRVEPAPDAPLIVLAEHDGAWFLLSDGAPIGMYPADRIIAELKAHITSRLAQSASGGDVLLHTAMLCRNGKGVFLCGAPGAGKTTLTLGLAASGWGYASDDIVHFSARDGFAGIPFSPAAKSGSWPLLDALIPTLRPLPVHLRRDEQLVRYVPIDRFARCDRDRVDWGFLLSRRDGAAATIEPLEPLHFLSELLGGAFSAQHRLQSAVLAALVDRISAMACGRLIYSDLPSAITLLEETVDG